MKTIAIMLNGVVQNLAAWDGSSTWNPVEAGICDATIDVSDIVPPPQIGSTYAGGVFTPPAPPPAQPDPNAFGAAVLADSSITMASRLLVASWIPGLVLALQADNIPLISSTWSDLCTQYAISSADQSAITALATQYAIPGL